MYEQLSMWGSWVPVLEAKDEKPKKRYYKVVKDNEETVYGPILFKDFKRKRIDPNSDIFMLDDNGYYKRITIK